VAARKELLKMASDPDPIDKHVGNRIRLRRLDIGCSQTKLAKAVGVAFQQVQKYEKGTNRIAASRLYKLAKILGVPITFSPEAQKFTPPPKGVAGNAQI
jgi:transcriptional regulator with XRE-family HTH domain